MIYEARDTVVEYIGLERKGNPTKRNAARIEKVKVLLSAASSLLQRRTSGDWEFSRFSVGLPLEAGGGTVSTPTSPFTIILEGSQNKEVHATVSGW